MNVNRAATPDLHDASRGVIVQHNAAEHRFEAVVDGRLCRANYRRMGNVLALNHTEVPRPLEGRGIAGALVDAAVAFARANGMRIAPYCSYVRGYFQRKPEARDILA